MEKKNELLKNLYLTEPIKEKKKIIPLNIKGIELIQSYPKLGKIKPGGIIIQKWETKNRVPSDVDNLSLPIIVDKRKLVNSLLGSGRTLTEENQIEKSSDNFSGKELRKFFLKNDKDFTRNFNTEPSNQYLFTGESTHIETSIENTKEEVNNNYLKPKIYTKIDSVAEYVQKNSFVKQPILTKVESSLVSKLKNKIIDFTNLKKIETLTENEFIYCKRVGNHIEYEECTYNQLKIQDKTNQKIIRLKDNAEYITISKNTVLHFVKGITTLYTINEWKENYIKSQKIMNIPLFKNYRIKKLYDLWRNFVKKHKKKFYEEKLRRKSIHVDPFLLEGIFNIRRILDELKRKLDIFKIDIKNSAMTIINFQKEHRQNIMMLDQQLEEYRNKIKKEVHIACNRSYDVFKEQKKITLEDNYDFKYNDEEEEEEKENGKLINKKNEKKGGTIVQNLLKDTMPYAQDATRRTHYKKLLRYIRLIDLLFNDAKCKLISSSLETFTNKLQKLYVEKIPSQISDSPLIVFFIHPQNNTLKIKPHYENIDKIIFEEFLTEKIYTVINRKCFIESKEFPNYMVCFEEVFETAVDQNHNLNIRIREEPRIKELLSIIRKIVDDSYNSIILYSNTLLPILIKFNEYEALNFNELNNEKADLLKDYLERFMQMSIDITNLMPIIKKGIFELDLKNLIDLINLAPAKWIHSLRELIPKIAIFKLKELIKNLNLCLKQLNVRPNEKDVETFITLKNNLDKILENKSNTEEFVQEIDEILTIINSNKEIKIPEYDSKLIIEKKYLCVDYQKKIDAASYFIEMNIVNYRKELKEKIENFDKKIHYIKNRINTDNINKYSKEQFNAIMELENQSVRIKKKEEKKSKFIALEKDIKMEVFSNFENLDNLLYEYEVKSKLWYSLRDFQEHSEEWKRTHIFNLKIDAINYEIDQYIEIAKIAKVDLDNTNIPQILLDQAIVYKKIIPVLQTFQNPNVVNNSNRFFPMISKILSIETHNFDNFSFTLEKVFSLGIEEKVNSYILLSIQADEEKILTEKFSNCKSVYQDKRIPLVIFPRGNNINDKAHKYYIKEEEINNEYDYVDERLMELQKMLLNPYIDILKDNVQLFLQNFYKYLTFLDEYSKLQTYWFKCENYISINAQELLKYFPIEIKKLNNIENSIKSLGKIFKDNNFLLSKFIDTSHAKVIESLKTINKSYDEFYRFIEDSLNFKREDCNKYYFLSNEELLTLFSSNNNLEYLSQIIGKMINGIKTIDFGNDSDEIVKIFTTDNEQINLKIQKNRPVKDVIDLIERGIVDKIKFGFRLAKKDIKDNFRIDFKKFFPDILKNKEFLGQVIFMYIYSIMCDYIVKALNTQGDIFDKLLDIKLECKERKTAMISILQEMNLDLGERKKLINIISLENYYNELIKNLIREDVGSTNDFGWIKYISVSIESDDCRIDHLSNKFEYGYEYVGIFSSFILPVQTERVFVTLSNSIYNKKPIFAYGLESSGKKETLKNLSRLFGKSLIIFKCTENFEEKAFDKLEKGISKSENWLCLDNIENLSLQTLSILALKIISFYRNYFCKTDTKSNIQIICSSNIKSKMKIVDSMKLYFRLIGISPPDLGYIINLSLKNLGFSENKRELKEKIKFAIEYLNLKFKDLSEKKITMVLFNKFISILKKKIHKRKSSNHNMDSINNLVRRCLEKTFMLILGNDDYGSLNKFLKSLFNYQEIPSKQVEIHKDILDKLIDENTKSYIFSNNEYKNKIKSIIQSLDKRDYIVLVGPPISGKSYSLDLIKQIKKEEFDYIKIFPKAFDAKKLFSENPKATRIQFYNDYFINMIKILYEREKKRDLSLNLSLTSKTSSYALNAYVPNTTNYKIVCFDGQIDPLWIDNLNVLHDENKIQSLTNADSINLGQFKIYFETNNLKYCTPSFVSKVTIIHFDQRSLSWENIFYKWLNNSTKLVNSDLKNYVRGLFENYFPKLYDFIWINKLESIHFQENFIMSNLINLYDVILPHYNFEDKKVGKRIQNLNPKIEIIKKSALSIFIFSASWILSFFSNYILKNKIEKYIGDLFKPDDLKGPIFDYFIDDINHEYTLWNDHLENILPNELLTIEESIFIPHVENISYIWILEKYMTNTKPVLYLGKPDSGKSLLIKTLLNKLEPNKFRFINYLINYNSESKKLEEFLLKNMFYIKRFLIGDQQDRNFVWFVDDVNLQKSDIYHSKNCLEIIRQVMNVRSIFDTYHSKSKDLLRLNCLCSGNLLSFGRNENTDRFVHKFNIIVQNIFSNENNLLLFKPRIENHLKNYVNNNTISITATQYAQISILINETLTRDLLPSPIRLQYRFNLRDVNRIFETIFLTPYHLDSSEYLKFFTKIWYYETCRQYSDKLLPEDIKKFDDIVKNCCKNAIKFDFDTNLLFAPNISTENYIYTLYEDINEIHEKMKLAYNTYCTSIKHQHVILNLDNLKIVLKTLRILKLKKGHLIMMGTNLVGKGSLSQFSANAMKQNFLEIDENILEKTFKIKIEKSEKNNKSKNDNLQFWIKYIKKILSDILYKNAQFVLYFGSKIMQNDIMLEQINILMNTSDIETNYGKIEQEDEKSKNSNLNIVTDYTDKEIFDKIENNLHFIISVNQVGNSYQKLFYNYFFISKNCYCLYNDSYDSKFLNQIVQMQLDPKIQLNLIDNITNLFNDIHNTAQSLASAYEDKFKLKIEFSSKNFLDMVNYYKKYSELFRNRFRMQIESLARITSSSTKCDEVIMSAKEEIERNKPLKSEKENLIESKRQEIIEKKKFNTNLSFVNLEDEKPLNIKRAELAALDEEIITFLSPYRDNIMGFEKLILKFDNNDLIQIRNTNENMAVAKFIIGQLYSLAGESSEWEFFKKNTDMKFIKKALEIQYDKIDKIKLKIITDTVISPEFVYDNLKDIIYQKTKIICEWFRTNGEYFSALDNIKNKFEIKEIILKKIKEYENAIQSKKEIINKTLDEIFEIDKNIGQIERAKENIQTIIDKKNNYIETYSHFKEIISRRMEFWKKKEELTQINMQNCDFYAIFFAAYMSYASVFNYSYRKKLKNFFTKKAEQLNINLVVKLDYYYFVSEFLEIKNDKQALLLTISRFEEFTRENILLMKMIGVTPYLIDHFNITKQILKELYQTVKLTFIGFKDLAFVETVDKILKEGSCLVVEQVFEQSYTELKHIIKENYTQLINKSVVNFDYEDKDINEKFNLILVHNNHKLKISSQVWLNTTVLNFIPPKEQIKYYIRNELLLYENPEILTEILDKTSDNVRSSFLSKKCEKEIFNIFANYDFQGITDRINSNKELLEKLIEEDSRLLGILENISLFNERKNQLIRDNLNCEMLSNDSSKIYKLISKFIYVDNFYNYSLGLFSKIIVNFLKEHLQPLKKLYEPKEDLKSLIVFIFLKIGPLFKSNDRKLLKIILLCHYLCETRVIYRSYKQVIFNFYRIFFKKNDSNKYNQESPLPSHLDNFAWNSFIELNDLSGSIFQKLIDSITESPEEWEKFFSKEFNFNLPNEKLEKSSNVFVKLIFFTITKPIFFDKILENSIFSIFDKKLDIQKVTINKLLSELPIKKIILVIDDSSLSEMETIKLYNKKINPEKLEDFQILSMKGELLEEDLGKIVNSMKIGSLTIVKNAHFINQSLNRLSDILNDPKSIVHENFRLVFISPSNNIISNPLFENCSIFCSDYLSVNTMKDYVFDILENLDNYFFDSLVNQKKNILFARKIFFHLLIVHSIIKQYYFFDTNIYHIPFEFNKKDLSNCLYFVTHFIKNMDKDKDDAQNYITLINLVFEVFYAGRLIYKEDFNRVIKLLLRYFEDDKFFMSDFYFYYKENSKLNIKVEEKDLTLNEIARILNEIPLDSYYSLLENINPILIKQRLNEIPKSFFSSLNFLYGTKSLDNIPSNLKNIKIKNWKFNEMIIKLKEIKSNLPVPLETIGEESNPSFMKINKNGELINPLDESLNREIILYHNYLAQVLGDVDNMMKIYAGLLIYNESYDIMLQAIADDNIPKNWMKNCFPINLEKVRSQEYKLSEWIKDFEFRMSLLRSWYRRGELDVYWIPLFFNLKLFKMNIINYYSKKKNLTPDKVSLRFILEETDDIKKLTKDHEKIYINGMILDTCGFDYENKFIVKSDTPSKVPIIRIDFIKKEKLNESNNSENEEDQGPMNIIPIPIYERQFKEEFYNIEPLGYVDFNFDDKENTFDYWMSVRIRLAIDI